MVTTARAAALLLFAGLFAATLGGQADAAPATAVASGQDDSLMSRTTESAMLRGLASTRGASAARRLNQLDESEYDTLMSLLDKLMTQPNDNPDPYHGRRSLMGLRSA